MQDGIEVTRKLVLHKINDFIYLYHFVTLKNVHRGLLCRTKEWKHAQCVFVNENMIRVVMTVVFKDCDESKWK